MSTSTLVGIAVSGIIIFILPFLIPFNYRLWLAVLLSVPQLYLFKIGDFYPSCALILALSLWPETLKFMKCALRFSPIIFIICLMLMHAVSILWSSDIRLCIRTLVYMFPFITISVSIYTLAQNRKNDYQVITLLSLLVLLISVHAMIVILFRISPHTEGRFFNSKMALFFINPNTLMELGYGIEGNYVLTSLKKLGGFFVNGNVACVYMGMGGIVSWAISRIKYSKFMYLISIISMLAVFFGGSKAGMLIIFLINVLIVIFWILFRDNIKLRDMLSFLLVCMISYSLYLGYSINRDLRLNTNMSVPEEAISVNKSAPNQVIKINDFLNRVKSTTNDRIKIWKYGLESFSENPIKGQGFGGWKKGFSKYANKAGLDPDFPPHNTLIYLWSQSGLFAVIFGICFMCSVLYYAAKLALSNNRKISLLAIGFGFSSLWLFVQGMGTNYGIVGEQHQVVLLGFMVGMMCAFICRSEENEAENNNL